MTLPPGISEKTFNRAMTAFGKVVGEQWLFTSEEDVNLYRDAYSPYKGSDEEYVASAAVAPQTVEEVQAIVRLANEYKIPLYPISTGKNLGYGGSAPSMSGSVVLDLKRMNKVLEVNEKNAYALVEPGVSYFDLYRHIQDKGYKLWIDPPDPGWGSLIGNAMDRGGGWTATKFRNHFDAHCGMEVVLPNGELMRTGMGAMPAAKTWQQYKTGFGPWVDGMFSQSNFGIVTKMGFWLMPEPDAYFSGMVSLYKYKDLIPLIDILNLLENMEVFTGIPLLQSPLTTNRIFLGGEEGRAPLKPEIQEILSRSDGPPYKELEDYCQANQEAMWGCKLQFYGPPDVIKAQWAYCKKRFSEIDGVTFQDLESYEFPLTEEQIKKVHKVNFGIPNLDVFFSGARSESIPEPIHGHIAFSPVIPRNGEDVFKAHKVFSEAGYELGISPKGNPPAVLMTNMERAFLYVFAFPVTPDPAVNAHFRQAFKKLVKIASDNGWGEYRTAPTYYDDIMATYSFNNNALLRFHETVKDAIDPNGIIAPGRYGIWPKHLRKEKKP